MLRNVEAGGALDVRTFTESGIVSTHRIVDKQCRGSRNGVDTHTHTYSSVLLSALDMFVTALNSLF